MSAIKDFFSKAGAFLKKRGLSFLVIVVVIAAIVLLCALWIADTSTSAMYTVWLYTAQDTSYYKDYSDNPVLQYMLSKDEYDGISFSFTVPAAGTQSDAYNTLLIGRDFPTLMDSSVADPAGIMYENGYILDITDYVKEDMPNYYSMLNPEDPNYNETLYSKVVFNVDGEDRILALATVYESTPYTFTGYEYRRDWVAKYGKDPSTGEPFTIYSDDTSAWSDNVKFPSYYGMSYTMGDDSHTLSENAATKAFMESYAQAGYSCDGSEPLTISDWEWMFDIFTTAMDTLGIDYNGSTSATSDDGYCISMYYPGYTALAGGLRSSFDGSGMVWYQDEDGNVGFGGTENGTREYFKCLNTWYNNKWLDQTYNERTTDAYYTIDTAAVAAGRVGMWCGLESALDGNYDTGDYTTRPFTEGMMAEGCAYPVNDVYDYSGTGEDLYKIPAYLSNTSTIGTGFFVMEGADSVDLDPLFKFMDEFYSEEGALMHTLGLSGEQVSSGLSSTATQFYDDYNLSDGAYTVETDSSGNKTYKVNPVISNDSGGLSLAASLNKLPGYEYVSSLDYGYTDTHQQALDLWVKYKNTAMVWGSDAMNRMTASDKDFCETVNTNVDEYMIQNVKKFIKGDLNVDNSRNWSAWVSGVSNAAGSGNIDAVSEIFASYLAQYPLV